MSIGYFTAPPSTVHIVQRIVQKCEVYVILSPTFTCLGSYLTIHLQESYLQLQFSGSLSISAAIFRCLKFGDTVSWMQPLILPCKGLRT